MQRYIYTVKARSKQASLYTVDIKATVTEAGSLSGLSTTYCWSINIFPHLCCCSLFYFSFFFYTLLIPWFLSHGVNLWWWGIRGPRVLKLSPRPQKCKMYVWYIMSVCVHTHAFCNSVCWPSGENKAALQWLTGVLRRLFYGLERVLKAHLKAKFAQYPDLCWNLGSAWLGMIAVSKKKKGFMMVPQKLGI